MERRRWLDGPAYAELLGLAQVLPGPNIGNLAVVFGAREAGPGGAAAALAGLLAAPVAAAILIACLAARLAPYPAFRAALHGLGAAAAGLLAATALRLLPSPRGRPALFLLAIGAALAAGPLGAPILALLAGLVPLSIWLGLRELQP